MKRQLNVVGFISGGKDSFFSLLHCLANGHNVIALANLYPPSHARGDNDLNSLMYQTVGYGLVPLYEEILSVPLYRKEIRGTAISQAKDYCALRVELPQDITTPSVTAEDETESMVALLDRIKADHPEANAVCSGAILSAYQRTRIESVAVRMQMVSLAYLWQYPTLPTPVPRKEGLLEDMAAVGLDARIVKVASGGLDEDLLLANICLESTRKAIAKAVKRFGGSVLGEGGELETFVVDGPHFFSKGALEVKKDDGKIIRGGGGEAWMTFAGGGIKWKKIGQEDDTEWSQSLRIPDLLDDAFRNLLEKLDKETVSIPGPNLGLPVTQSPSVQFDQSDRSRLSTGKQTVKISNLCSPFDEGGTEAQMHMISHNLAHIVDQIIHRSVHDIFFTTILLRSMDDFHIVNRIYSDRFSARPNPPARVTIACGDRMPDGVNVMVSVVVSLRPRLLRQSLHVQSMSYWAPANIGPYSQAISVPLGTEDDAALVYIAGQIPLIPASMEIATRVRQCEDPKPMQELGDFRLQTALALQHLWRIGNAMNASWWIGATAFIVSSNDDIRMKVFATALAWKTIHTQGDSTCFDGQQPGTDIADFDVWEQQRNKSQVFVSEEQDNILPDLSRLSVVTPEDPKVQIFNRVVPPLFVVEIAQLPRSSEVEWQSVGISRAPIKFFNTIPEGGISVTACSVASDETIVGYIGIEHMETETDILTRIEQALLLLQYRCKVPDVRYGHKTIYTAHKLNAGKFNAQLIPCKSVWSVDGHALTVAIIVEYEKGMGA